MPLHSRGLWVAFALLTQLSQVRISKLIVKWTAVEIKPAPKVEHLIKQSCRVKVMSLLMSWPCAPNKVIHSPQKELTLFEAVMEVHTNHGRDISRGVKSRQKSGRDRDGLPDFLTNRDRDGDRVKSEISRGDLFRSDTLSESKHDTQHIEVLEYT